MMHLPSFRFVLGVVCGIVFAQAPGIAWSLPVDAFSTATVTVESRLFTGTNNFGDSEVGTGSTSSERAVVYSPSSGNSVSSSARASLTSGQVGFRNAVSSNGNQGGTLASESVAYWQDFLTFSAGGVVSYDLFLDGSFGSSLNDNTLSNAFLSVDIIDVTGVSDVFQDDPNNPTFIRPEVYDSGLVNSAQLDFEYPGGSTGPIGESTSSSFTAIAGHSYLVSMLGASGADIRNGAAGVVVLDLLNTGSLRLTSVGGAEFSSLSGGFLANGVTAVPLPATMPLFLLALGGMGLIGKRRLKSGAGGSSST